MELFLSNSLTSIFAKLLDSPSELHSILSSRTFCDFISKIVIHIQSVVSVLIFFWPKSDFNNICPSGEKSLNHSCLRASYRDILSYGSLSRRQFTKFFAFFEIFFHFLSFIVYAPSRVFCKIYCVFFPLKAKFPESLD